MINIIIPMAGGNQPADSSENYFPGPLIEIGGKPLIELIINNLSAIKEETKFIFIVKEEDCDKFYLDNTIRLLSENCEIIKLRKPTQGAVCSCLMAIESVNNDDHLLIANGNQIIDVDYNEVLEYFNKNNCEAGVITFESVHPKWSYVRLDKNDNVVETAEKKPISKNAIAGFYYFNKGSGFVNAAFKMILNDRKVNGLYFIAPTFNDLILENKKIGVFKIKSECYHSFYTTKKINEFENESYFKTITRKADED